MKTIYNAIITKDTILKKYVYDLNGFANSIINRFW